MKGVEQGSMFVVLANLTYLHVILAFLGPIPAKGMTSMVDLGGGTGH